MKYKVTVEEIGRGYLTAEGIQDQAEKRYYELSGPPNQPYSESGKKTVDGKGSSVFSSRVVELKHRRKMWGERGVQGLSSERRGELTGNSK